MNKSWTLSDFLFRSTHQWPLVIFFILAGGLAGWGSQYIWPSYYRAGIDIYVGLNPYRAFDDAAFLALARPKYSNIDDFKNWQMSQLESVIFSDAFIEATLAQLQSEDAYWQQFSKEDLSELLETDWRSAGTWSLFAKYSDPERASQVVEAWADQIAPRIKDAVQAAQDTFMIDQELETSAQASVQAEIRWMALIEARSLLQTWQKNAASLPQDQPPEPAERWRVLSLATQLAQFTPAWTALLEDQPAATESLASYIAWIDQVTALMDAEATELAQRGRQLDQQQIDLAVRYSAASHASLGLSPNLEILNLQTITPKVVRPTGTLIIIGGLAGLFAWIFFQLAVFNNSGEGTRGKSAMSQKEPL